MLVCCMGCKSSILYQLISIQLTVDAEVPPTSIDCIPGSGHPGITPATFGSTVAPTGRVAPSAAAEWGCGTLLRVCMSCKLYISPSIILNPTHHRCWNPINIHRLRSRVWPSWNFSSDAWVHSSIYRQGCSVCSHLIRLWDTIASLYEM